MESVSLAFTSGWASGINSYPLVLVLGIADRVGDLAQVPDVLGRWEVLAVAAFLYAMEFVADKIPFIDSTWDAISTAIRPTVGAVIGVLLAGEATSLDQAVSGVVGGGTALASHLVKMGGRLAINSSPEPVTKSWPASPRTRSSWPWSGSPSSTRGPPPPSPPYFSPWGWSCSTPWPG